MSGIFFLVSTSAISGEFRNPLPPKVDFRLQMTLQTTLPALLKTEYRTIPSNPTTLLKNPRFRATFGPSWPGQTQHMFFFAKFSTSFRTGKRLKDRGFSNF